MVILTDQFSGMKKVRNHNYRMSGTLRVFLIFAIFVVDHLTRNLGVVHNCKTRIISPANITLRYYTKIVNTCRRENNPIYGNTTQIDISSKSL